jgi:hypothetical protein
MIMHSTSGKIVKNNKRDALKTPLKPSSIERRDSSNGRVPTTNQILNQSISAAI